MSFSFNFKKIFLYILLFSFLIPVQLKAISVSPAEININNIRPGQKANREARIGNRSLNFDVLEIQKKDELNLVNIPKFEYRISDKKLVEIPLEINIPSTVNSGTYNVKFTYLFKKVNKDGYKVNFNINQQVNIKITDKKIVEFKIESFNLPSSYSGETVTSNVKIFNSGNIGIDPKIKIYNNKTGNIAAENKEKKKVDPGEKEIYSLNLGDDIKKGTNKYKVEASVGNITKSKTDSLLIMSKEPSSNYRIYLYSASLFVILLLIYLLIKLK